MKRSVLSLLLMAVLAVSSVAQASTGTIAGTIRDEQGALIANANVTIINTATGASRVVQTNDEGAFSAASLLPGSYDIRVEAQGFSASTLAAQVATGGTTTLNLTMKVGQTREVVEVQGGVTPLDVESNTIQGVVTRRKIENLPLNGRSFLNLAQLEPGVTVAPGNPAQFNAQFNVSVLGAPASRTAITIDGGNVRNPIEGGTGQNFSQELVQEFQISTTNFDLSTGITGFGAINVVTRSGTNDFHGAGYFYFRDHNIAAYPSLVRNPFTDDPFFARRQSGFLIGGPIKKDKIHFFGNYEYTNQAGVYIVQPDLPSAAAFGTIAAAPYYGRQFSGRVDYLHNDKHSGFVRYSHDGNRNSGPFTAAVPVPPSNFVANKNWVDQYLLGVTSTLSTNVVNDFRFSYFYWQNRNIPAPCVGDPNGICIGAGGPETTFVGSVNFQLGNNFNSPQGRDLRRFPVSDNVSWQKGTHRIKFGGEWEHFDGTGYWGFFDPANVIVLPPETFGPAAPLLGIPTVLRNYEDIKRLPVVFFILGIGDRAQPSFNLEKARSNERFHFYVQDTWKVTPRFTLNYGLGWAHETNLLNYDLPKPSLVASLYGNDLSPTEKQYKNFTPAVGFAWSLGSSNQTVIRAGAGIFYDTQLGWWRLGERAVLGGSGRQFILSSSVINPATGAPFTFGFPFSYRLGNFLNDLPALRRAQELKYPGTGTEPQILLSKQANALGALYPREFPTTQVQHFNIGVQHELPWKLVVQGDFVYRHTIHGTPAGAANFFGASVDYNQFFAVRGPKIRRCAGAEANDPDAICSSGPFNFWWPGATAKYKALLLKVDRRFSSRYSFTASYAFQDSKSVLDVNTNLDDFFASYGPDQARHNLNVSAIADLPYGFQVSMLSTYLSRPPVSPRIVGVNYAGTDIQNSSFTPLLSVLGQGYSDFLSESELRGLVTQYNSSIAGTPTPAGAAGVIPGQVFPAITLPASFQLGDRLSSQDLRVMKTVKIGERVDLRLIGEVFNLFNVSNLANFNFNLGPTFGQPNQRVGQTFGSGGPRAFQFGARIGF